MYNQREFDLMMMAADLELEKLFTEFERMYLGGRNGETLNDGNETDNGLEIPGEADKPKPGRTPEGEPIY